MIKVGDIVKVIDGSYSARLDKYERRSCIGLSKDSFRVIWVSDYQNIIHSDQSTYLHDIHIQNTKTGEIYLHSSAFVRNIEMKRKWREAVANEKTVLGYEEWMRARP